MLHHCTCLPHLRSLLRTASTSLGGSCLLACARLFSCLPAFPVPAWWCLLPEGYCGLLQGGRPARAPQTTRATLRRRLLTPWLTRFHMFTHPPGPSRAATPLCFVSTRESVWLRHFSGLRDLPWLVLRCCSGIERHSHVSPGCGGTTLFRFSLGIVRSEGHFASALYISLVPPDALCLHMFSAGTPSGMHALCRDAWALVPGGPPTLPDPLPTASWRCRAMVDLLPCCPGFCVCRHPPSSPAGGLRLKNPLSFGAPALLPSRVSCSWGAGVWGELCLSPA